MGERQTGGEESQKRAREEARGREKPRGRSSRKGGSKGGRARKGGNEMKKQHMPVFPTSIFLRSYSIMKNYPGILTILLSKPIQNALDLYLSLS